MARTRPAHLGLVAVAAGVVVAFAVAVFVGASFSSSSPVEGLKIGGRAPAWSGTSLSGAHLTSKAERGHWVILNFFATWCDGCKRETPQLKQFVADHSTSQVEVVSILYEDSTADARAYVAHERVTWPILSAGTGSAAKVYQAERGLPETYVIDPSGRLVRSFAGAATVSRLDRDIAGARS
jgi:peroxiredoxin